MQTIDGDSWLRTDDFGIVDRLESESVVTSFYKVIFPLWPEHSAYVIRAADGSERRIKIPLQTRSVVLGYLRAPTWFASFVLGLPALMLPDPLLWLLGPALVLLALACVLTFVAGRLGEAEAMRRALLKRVLGFGAPPELLTETFRDEVRARLEQMWDSKVPHLRWTDAIERGDPSELLIALAEYHQDPDLIALAHLNAANRIWN